PARKSVPPTAAAVTSCLAPPGGDGIRRQEPDNGPLAVEGGDAAGVEVAGVDVERGAGHFPPPPGQGLRVQAASPSSRTAAPKAAVTRHVRELTPDSLAASGTGTGDAAWTASSTRSDGSARASRRIPGRPLRGCAGGRPS